MGIVRRIGELRYYGLRKPEENKSFVPGWYTGSNSAFVSRYKLGYQNIRLTAVPVRTVCNVERYRIPGLN